MAAAEGTVAELLEFLSAQASAGSLTRTTADAYASAVRQIFEITGAGWESANVYALDLDDEFARFARTTRDQYKASTLQSYKSRLYKSVSLYKRTRAGTHPLPRQETLEPDGTVGSSGRRRAESHARSTPPTVPPTVPTSAPGTAAAFAPATAPDAAMGSPAGQHSAGAASASEAIGAARPSVALRGAGGGADSLVITHQFPLRPGMLVTVALPTDLSPTEARRLTTFVHALAVEPQP